MEAIGKSIMTIALLALIASARTAGQVRIRGGERGGQWLSWSETERTIYVDGYITGYLQGRHQACDLADDLFGTAKTYGLGDKNHPSDMPSARCLARTDTYSKIGFKNGKEVNLSAYTDVLTEFYTKHPEYDGISFVDLLRLLSDRNYKSADELYQMALKGKLQAAR